MLFIGAGLMLRSLFKMQQVEAGIVSQRVLALRTTLSCSKYTTNEQSLLFVNKLLDRLKSEPGVLSVAISDRYPFEPEIIATGAQAFLSPLKSKADPSNLAKPLQSPPSPRFHLIISRH